MDCDFYIVDVIRTKLVSSVILYKKRKLLLQSFPLLIYSYVKHKKQYRKPYLPYLGEENMFLQLQFKITSERGKFIEQCFF